MTTQLTLTLDDCQQLLALYEAMAAAANDNQWETLFRLETQATAIRNAASQRPPVVVADAQNAAEMARLIEQILFFDREVRSHALPQLESTRKMLSGSIRNRAVHAAYGAHGP